MSAGSGDDTMVAGAGVDIFYGGAGQSTYQVGANAGQVTIVNANATDVLQLGSGININDISVAPDTFSNGATGYYISVASGTTVAIQGGSMTSVQIGGTTFSLADLDSTAFTQGNTVYSQVDNGLPYVDSSDLASANGASGLAGPASLKTAVSPALTNLTLFGGGDLVGQGNNVNDVITANTGNDTLIAGTANGTHASGSQTPAMRGYYPAANDCMWKQYASL